MKEHHARSIRNLVRLLEQDKSFEAVIISGSIAKGIARDDSDVDAYLVVTDSEFARRQAERDLFYYNADVCDYPGGYVDGKIIPQRFLEAAASHGSEPTRASFIGSSVAITRIPGLERLVQQIPVYPEENRERNLIDFYAQVLLYGHYFAKQAFQHNNPYLLAHSVSQVVLFAGRMLLAYNRILFPGHKSLMRAVEGAPDKPERYLELAGGMLSDTTPERLEAFVRLIGDFQDWGLTYRQAVSTFVENNEWNWMDAPPPLADR